MTQIIIPGVPLSWKAPYVGSKGAYSVRTPIMDQMRMQLRSTYTGPFFTTPITCDLRFYMPIPKATSKKRRLMMIGGILRPAGTPDRTNLAKFIEDVLQGVVYANDSQIIGGVVQKWYDENPRTEIYIFDV